MSTRALTRDRPGVIGAVPSDAGFAFVDTGWGRVSLTHYRNFDDARPIWNRLQTNAPVTHAQSYACARLWHETVSGPEGAQAAIFAGRSDNGGLLFVWPLEVVTRHGLRILKWIGQDHANYNMGVFNPEFAATATPGDIKSLLRTVADMAGGLSLAHFRNQPADWEGVPNPFAKLAARPSPNRGYAVLLDQDFDTLYRNRFSGRTRNTLRRKERRLSDLGPLKFGWADSAAQRHEIFDIYSRQKSAWFARHGIADPFGNERIRTFYEKLSQLPEDTPGHLALGYLKVGGTVAATFHGAMVGKRFHMLLSSIADGETERWSPGILLMRNQIRDICGRGCLHYDLGSGLARHKSEWCDEEIPLYDSFIALDEAGYLLKIPMTLLSGAKRWIKNSPALWALATSIRKTVFRR